MRTDSKMSGAFAYALEKTRSAIAYGTLLEEGEGVLCALSGGADSVALLLLLNELDVKLCAAHLNHGIRGEEADRDEEFCKKLCAELNVPFVSEKADVPAEAEKNGKGLEETAREIRYEFLNRVACENGCTKICTAHHADDNIETVLLHMIRGCGLNGLTGIAPKRGNIVRPLLTLRKQELVDAVKEKGYTFVHDSTNDQTYNTRNYIRHNILPHIYRLNEGADKTFYRMCVSLEADNAYLDFLANEFPANMSREELARLETPLLARYIRKRYSDAFGQGRFPDSYSLELVIEAIKGAKTVKYDVTGDVTAYISASGVEFCPRKREFAKVDMPLEIGENIISPIGYSILITDDEKTANSFTKIYKEAILTQVSFDKIIKNGKSLLFVRVPRQGDKYVYGNMTRDVRRQLKNEKIPRQSRDTLPVIYAKDGIVIVHGLRIADSYRPEKNGKTACIIINKL
jgi:tRNA(Ile)-lysidine synthase